MSCLLYTSKARNARAGERHLARGSELEDHVGVAVPVSYTHLDVYKRQAVLKEKSPSCGCGQIYDGTFSRRLTEGDGVTVELFKAHGIVVCGESDVEKL